ncbi:flagellar hook-basal body protein [Noviherbaspirillum pedocola]|uniref:Flagellar hook basal-body protein n=1 Tax=Noviherbaspirillum pedocola TaxID=2801341 RepID=A0A934W7K3_9BURK|nr:flagellar hook basal-body protein [Noviherbaspirillum pedocola]MBK4735688.1 flagellar hook basal-body protein [Noviherbaspirillum pedocola]
MPDGAAIAAASMSLDSERIRIISQNLANMATPGYKRALPVSTIPQHFAEALNLLDPAIGAPASVSRLPIVEHQIDFHDAPTRHTGNSLDLAIEGAGFFELSDASGTYYTRQGNFSIDATGLLTGPNGETVSGVGGDIRLESGAVRIDRQGRIVDGRDNQLGQIKLVGFDDASRLQAVGNGRYRRGSAQISSEPVGAALRQGMLEASNVNSAYEMTKLLDSLRHFQNGAQVLRAYDQMGEKALTRLGEF